MTHLLQNVNLRSLCRFSALVLQVANDEASHFQQLQQRLEAIGSSYGALPVHDGLWESAAATAHRLPARRAIESCVHEARGLDRLPHTIQRFRNSGDGESAKLLEKIYQVCRALTARNFATRVDLFWGHCSSQSVLLLISVCRNLQSLCTQQDHSCLKACTKAAVVLIMSLFL